MARNATKENEAAAVEPTTADQDSKPKTTTRKALTDTDEIEIISLIPNVSYRDNKTDDYYEWDEIGHMELMTMESIKNMWRSHKAYFRNLWLKINDERVIKRLGLDNLYKEYAFLMDKGNYTRENINVIAEKISQAPNGLKFSVYSKIKSFISSGDVTDVLVIRKLESILGIDLFSLLQ